MKNNYLYLTAFILASCATRWDTNSPTRATANPYNIAYNSLANSCNNLIYYGNKYSKSSTPTSAKDSLWGLITTSDIGFANAAAKMSGQKDAIENIKPLKQSTLYSSTDFLDKCNFNPNYAEYCSTAYKAYLSGYKSESDNLTKYMNEKDRYIAGFSDSVNDCDNKFTEPAPLTPIDLK